MATELVPDDRPPEASAHRAVSRDELADYLPECAFPARQDDLLALLISKGAPSRLLWHVGRCSATRTYRSFDEMWLDGT